MIVKSHIGKKSDHQGATSTSFQGILEGQVRKLDSYKTIKVLGKFTETHNITGICGFYRLKNIFQRVFQKQRPL